MSADAIDPELQRLREIAALGLTQRVDDAQVQALVDRAADELDLPVAAVSIVLDSAQYFVASHGLGGWLEQTLGTPSEWAFCRHAVDRRAPFIVNDAEVHELVTDNPLVRMDGIRCYLGIPLITSRGQAIGTLCVLGLKTRQFDGEDIARMRDLAAAVMERLEARRQD